jgi:RNA recognition motif-containing protein
MAALAALAYFTIPAAEAIGTLATGLFLGHLIGSFLSGSDNQTANAAPSTAQTTHNDNTATTPAGNSETKTLYVGNIAFRAPRAALQELFESHGRVHSVRLMTDRNTRKPKGYGFVEMDDEAAESALEALDGNNFFGRDLRVSVAKQQEITNRQ